MCLNCKVWLVVRTFDVVNVQNKPGQNQQAVENIQQDDQQQHLLTV